VVVKLRDVWHAAGNCVADTVPSPWQTRRLSGLLR
jgi:hypothetical protein